MQVVRFISCYLSHVFFIKYHIYLVVSKYEDTDVYRFLVHGY